MALEKVDPLRAYSVVEVADRLNLSQHTVREMLKAGELRGLKAGRMWRVPASALDEYLRGASRAHR